MINHLQGVATLATTDLARSVSEISVAVMGAGSILLVMLIVKAVVTRQRWPQLKKPIFILIIVVVLVTTATLGSAALFINAKSATGGSVKWQAAYQIWACGNQLNLRDPRGLANRIGTAQLFERNDSQIHVEGIPMKLPDDASLGSFMVAVGGELSDNSLIVPLNDDNAFSGTPNTPEQLTPFLNTRKDGTYARFISGQRCGQTAAEVQAFVNHYSSASNSYLQTKLIHPANYEITHASNIPPGDCVIIEFAPPKDRTDHTCQEVTR